jgi:hypothetical protein
METDSTSSKLLLVAVTAATVAVCAVLAEAEASDRRVRKKKRHTHVQSARAARLLDLWVACNTVGRVGCCCNVLRRAHLPAVTPDHMLACWGSYAGGSVVGVVGWVHSPSTDHVGAKVVPASSLEDCPITLA